ncbi:MAG: exonuclease SbcCD subunit D C-terminal domain-containing protein, partial [Smithella sp.]
KERKIIEGIRSHYRLVCDAAECRRADLGKQIPIIAMGHLFTAGGRTTDGDGIRELYIGTLAQVKADVFPECIDYLALGHLHVSQTVGGSEFIRYCGSPLPMSFGEKGQQKGVVIVEFVEKDPAVRLIPVPNFQELQTIRGDWLQIAAGIAELKGKGSKAWLEIIYEGEEIIVNLQERLEEITAGSALEILRTKNNRLVERVLSGMGAAETLDDLNATEVFKRCMKANEVPEEQYDELLSAYQEIIVSIDEQDVREE